MLRSLHYIGFKKPVMNVTLVDRNEIIDILKCHCIKVALPEINQFCDGLKALGVLDYIKQYPDIMRDFFVDNAIRLTSSTVLIHNVCVS